MSFGNTQISDTDKVQERLPKNGWTIPPDLTETIEVTKQVGSLEAEIEILEYKIKVADTEAKEDAPRKPYERFKKTKDLEERLAVVKAELARARAAERIINRHVTVFCSYQYAIGKVY